VSTSAGAGTTSALDDDENGQMIKSSMERIAGQLR
jgi:hypothetical protein